MPLSQVARLVASSGLLLLFAGCDGNRLVEVTGIAYHSGKPIPNLIITFSAENGAKSVALTDQEGRFKMLSTTGKEGVQVGTHKVWVQLKGNLKEDSEGKKMQDSKKDPELLNVIEKYGSYDKTPKTIEIKEKQDIKLELD